MLLRFFRRFSFLLFLLCRKRKAVSDRLPHEWHKPSPTADKPGRIGIRPPKQVSTNGCPYFPWDGLPGFTLPAVFFFITVLLSCLGQLFWSMLSSNTDFLLEFLFQYASTSVYLHFCAFQLGRIRWSFSFRVQR